MFSTHKNKVLILSGTILSIIFINWACSKVDTDYTAPETEWLTGGSQTFFDGGNGAFGHAFNGMTAAQDKVHEIGDLVFEATFVSSPAPKNPGLGPLFNNVSCNSCHIGDGRSKIIGSDNSIATLFRVSLPGTNEHGEPLPVPGFGHQIQTSATAGKVREAIVRIAYTEKQFKLDDGTPYSLRYPTYSVENAYINFPSNALLSPRSAQPVFGLGLLDAIDEATILGFAAAQAKANDGISGRANYVWDAQKQKTVLGKYGWKANQPSLLQQVAAAFNQDIGITTPYFPVENSYGQPQHELYSNQPEITDSLLHAVEFYIRSLGVPGRRNATNTDVVAGKKIFVNIGCASCHIPAVRTKVNVAFPAVSNQLIQPYTDLLLHDMGEDLADNRPDFLASGREWRTQPLWGIGLTQRVNGHTQYLHDGRARNLTEAIMWHGGEAEKARNQFKALSATERNQIIKFLESL
ncbi:di-heme oxidoreductase family protein [Polluticaenibacter yanchengensis]|uniref:C-type cytochrome n=1 Tax=Polluticaenibacter yanchengensis TaxID=3014562 RepID=A0ABT4UN36_9BACT|nr:c-type cytochrome [Chitinophagaceae bacterium LY-5]